VKIFINDREIEIFRGATVLEAIHRYSERACRMVLNGTLLVIDRFGNLTEADGELTEGQKIHLKKK